MFCRTPLHGWQCSAEHHYMDDNVLQKPFISGCRGSGATFLTQCHCWPVLLLASATVADPVPLLLTQCHSNSIAVPNSWEGTASTAIKLWNEWSGFQFLAGARDFFFSKMSGLAVEPTSLLFNGNRESFPWVKETGAWSWPLTSNYAFMLSRIGTILPFFKQFLQAVHLEESGRVVVKLHMSDNWHSHCSYKRNDVAKRSTNCHQY
jgi:hypothetical protein